MANGLRQRVKDIVDIPSPPGNKVGQMFDAFIVTLIVLNTIAVVVETIPGVLDNYAKWVQAFELFSVAVFIGEYALRLWSITADPKYAHPVLGRLRWMATPFSIVDLLAIVPTFLLFADLRFVRVLRLLRLLKLGRYSESLRVLGNVLRRSRQELLMTLSIVLLALLLVSSFMYYAEHAAQPEVFSSIPAAMWWGIVALSTTGYGDVVPVTAIGRLLGGITALLGVAVIALPVGILSSRFVEEISARRAAKKANLCPHCGKGLP